MQSRLMSATFFSAVAKLSRRVTTRWSAPDSVTMPVVMVRGSAMVTEAKWLDRGGAGAGEELRSV